MESFKEKIIAISNFCIHFLIKTLIIVMPLFFVFGKGKHYYFSIYDI